MPVHSASGGEGTPDARSARVRLRAWGEGLRLAARAQLAVTLALAPLTMFFFQQVSVVSPLANALAIPVVSFIVTPLALLGGMVGTVFGIDWPLVWAHAVFAWLADPLGWLGRWSWASVEWPAPAGWTVALALAGLFMLAACGRSETDVASDRAANAANPAGLSPGKGGLSAVITQGSFSAVAADESRAAEVGRDILQAGGNATDAAVAMYFAMAVTLPSAAGLGASGACIVHDEFKGLELELMKPGRERQMLWIRQFQPRLQPVGITLPIHDLAVINSCTD